jgi:nucleoside-diphosphate-sugar epimerase
MKVLVAGATGAMGRHLVPLLLAQGHDVSGLARRESSQQALTRMGATPVTADALDAPGLLRAVEQVQPEVIVHQLTALSGSLDLRHFDRSFALTNRLRTEGTDNLLAAGRAVGVRRFVAQSYAGWTFARTGGPVKTELDPLDPTPPAGLRSTLAAIRYLEQAVTGADWTEGIALRYGGFYGPGTSLGPDGEHTRQIQARNFPVVGDGGGIWSFVHITDAAEATLAAVEHGRRGIYQVVDDDPAPVREWLPEIAAELGAPAPRHVPRWLGRLLAGEVAVGMMTDIRGADNTKARTELDWRPAHSSWRGQFTGLATAGRTTAQSTGNGTSGRTGSTT